MNITRLKSDRFILGVTTSVLFDMSEANSCFKQYGRDGYRSYMKERMNELLPLNDGFKYAMDFSIRENHEVVILSRNSPLTAIPAIRTMIHHGIVPSAFAFTNGTDPTRYIGAYEIDNFMSADKEDVKMAIARGHSACCIENPKKISYHSTRFNKASVSYIPTELQQGGNVVALGKRPRRKSPDQHHIFDGDGVIVDLSSDENFNQNGKDLYDQFEKANISRPMIEGPFHDWMEKLSRNPEEHLTSVCTKRGGWAAFRFLYDLARQNIEPSAEFHATSGRSKGKILSLLASEYRLKTLLYDDQEENIEEARKLGILAGHVIHPNDPKFTA